MATDTEYALMAGAAYISNIPDENKSPVPTGWQSIDKYYSRNDATGFEASVFQRGNEIVISFAGTNPADGKDWMTDLQLYLGVCAKQLLEAAALYLDICSDPKYANATISFTGHSLGGGLAALMGVFFNKKAVTFDQAPFIAAATTSVRDELITYLSGKGYAASEYSELTNFADLFSRQMNVSGYYVSGEVLSNLFPSSMIGIITPVILNVGDKDISVGCGNAISNKIDELRRAA